LLQKRHPRGRVSPAVNSLPLALTRPATAVAGQSGSDGGTPTTTTGVVSSQTTEVHIDK
jgi:hypothetical protein